MPLPDQYVIIHPHAEEAINAFWEQELKQISVPV